MTWQGIHGVDELALQFARANRRGRLGGSFLFVGPNGVGKRAFAFALAKTLLCRRHFPKNGDWSELNGQNERDDSGMSREEELERFAPCDVCECCKQFEFNLDSQDLTIPTHPDFHFVCKPEDKSLLPLELLIGDKDARSRAGLCFKLNQTAYMGGRKIAVIDDADFFNVEGANALLKTLEEPPPNSIIILLGTSAAKQLPTIRSRCQIFRFNALSNDALASILLKRGMVQTQEEADAIARNSSGSMEEARKALDRPLIEFQQTLMTELARERVLGVELATRICEFVDAAGKEPILRRKRLQNLLKGALSFYRELYLALEDSRYSYVGPTAVYVKRTLERGKFAPEDALDCMERTLEALGQIDRNANLPFIVEAWTYDVAKQTR